LGSVRLGITGIDAPHSGALTAFLGAQPVFEIVAVEDAEVLITGPAFAPSNIPTLVVGPDNPQAMITAVESGALGYVTEGDPLDEVARAARAVAEGEGVVPPLMLGALLKHVVQRQRVQRSELDRLDGLTEREREVFELAAQGLDRSSIAQRLFISVGTVRSHLQRVFRKLDVHSQAEVVALAARCGLRIDQEPES
jgi:DNA-binding NarL/FixJ family response regulator